MMVTPLTKEILRCRRERRRLASDGWQEVNENGGILWQLNRGTRLGHVITDVQIAPERRTIFIKTANFPGVKT